MLWNHLLLQGMLWDRLWLDLQGRYLLSRVSKVNQERMEPWVPEDLQDQRVSLVSRGKRVMMGSLGNQDLWALREKKEVWVPREIMAQMASQD